MDPQNIFKLSNVSKTYGNHKQVEVNALKNVNLNICKGEFTAIVGPSGSGKTTLLNVMSGLDKPSKGVICLAGQSLAQMSSNTLSDYRRDHIGFIFQAYNLLPVLTVSENIEYILLLQKVSKEERQERVKNILADVDLTGFEKRFPHELSGGQQQRVAVARAIVSRPDIILADEPTANLDSNTGIALIEMMKNLNVKYETTFIFSTHDLNIMEQAKRLVFLQDGQISKDEIKN